MAHEPLEKLRIYVEAKDLADIIFQLTKEVKQEFKLKDQAVRSSRSTADNIAEMYGAYYFAVKMHSLRIARAESYETINHLETFKAGSLLPANVCDDLEGRYFALIKSINGYIKYIKKFQEKYLSDIEDEK